MYRQGFAYYLGWVTIIQGWSLAVQGQREAGIEQMRQGRAALQSTGAKRALRYYLALLAEGYGAVGQTDEGLASLPRPLPQWQQPQSDGGEAEFIVSRANCFCKRQAASSRRRRPQKRVSVRRLRWLASSRRSLWNCEPP